MLAELIAITSLIVGGLLITNEKYKWVNKIISQFEDKTSTHIKKQYDVKKLNNEVFRKLTRVLCLEHYPFFENKFGFCIPKNTQLSFNESDRADIAFNTQLGHVYNIENYFNKMDIVITTLEVGENYLQQNYSQIHDSWMQIKHELDVMNKERQDFCNKVSDKIKDELTHHIKMKPTIRLIPFTDGWAYFAENVPRIVPLLFNKYGRLDLKMENPTDDQYYLVYGEYRIFGSSKKDRLDLRTINDILHSITEDDKLTNEHVGFQHRLIKLNNKIDSFCKELEKKVVNDIGR